VTIVKLGIMIQEFASVAMMIEKFKMENAFWLEQFLTIRPFQITVQCLIIQLYLTIPLCPTTQRFLILIMTLTAKQLQIKNAPYVILDGILKARPEFVLKLVTTAKLGIMILEYVLVVMTTEKSKVENVFWLERFLTIQPCQTQTMTSTVGQSFQTNVLNAI